MSEFFSLPSNTPPIQTFGWDTVSIVKLSDVNEAIRIAKTSPSSFSYRGAGLITGVFGDWALGAKSNGDYVQMFLPIDRITIDEFFFQPPRRLNVSGVAEVFLPLKFVPHDPDPSPPIATHKLMVNTSSKRKVKVVGVKYKGDRPSMFDDASIKRALGVWLDDNLVAFSHVFATVSIHKTVPKDSFRWLKPTYCDFAFGYNATDPDNSTFAILCQTGGRSAKGLERRAGTGAIPNGATVAFLVSENRFLRDMVAPALSHAFVGIHQNQLRVHSINRQISFKGEAKLAPVRHKRKTYKPILVRLLVFLRNQDFRLETTTRTRVSPGIYSMCETAGTYNFGLIKKSSGMKTMGFREAHPLNTKHWTEKSKAIIITEILLTLIGVVAFLAIEVVTAGAGTIPSIIIAGVIFGAFGGALTIKLIGAITRGDGPPLDLLVANATDSVTWAHGGAFDPIYVALNGSLQIGGIFKAPSICGFQKRFRTVRRIDNA